MFPRRPLTAPRVRPAGALRHPLAIISINDYSDPRYDLVAIQHRHLWCAGHRAWTSSYHDSGYQKRIDRKHVLRPRQENFERSTRYAGRDPTRQQWGWRLSSSWRGQNRYRGGGLSGPTTEHDHPKTKNDLGPFEGKQDDDPYLLEIRRKRVQMSERYHYMRKMLDHDAYGVLFGRRVELLDKSPSWSPHALFKSLWWWTRPPGTIQPTSNEAQSGERYRPRSLTHDSTAETAPVKATVDAKSIQDSIDFEIDPITLRKVKKPSNSQASDEAVDIPVSTFKGYRSQSSQKPRKDMISAVERPRDPVGNTLETTSLATPSNLLNDAGTASKGWLSKEGFASDQRPVMDTPRAEAVATASEDVSSPKVGTSSSALEYDTAEVRTDDVDLLRSSDVRAAAGVLKSSSKTAAETKKPSRESLETDFDTAGQRYVFNAEEKAAYESIRKHRITPATSEGSTENQSQAVKPASWVETENRIQSLENSYAADMDAHAATANDTDQAASTESTSPSPGGSGQKYPRLDTKRTDAVNASGVSEPYNKESRASAKTKSQKNGDDELVREIRGIYEEKYGTVDTSHRQADPKTPGVSSSTRLFHLEYCMRKLEQISARTDAIAREVGKIKSRRNSHSGTRRPSDASASQSQKPIHMANTSADATPITSQVATSTAPAVASPESPESIVREGMPTSRTPMTDTSLKESGSSDVTTGCDPKFGSNDLGRSLSSTYKILAYDPASHDISTAVTTSSAGASSPVQEELSPADVLPRLNYPARFLPHFAHLNRAGYEIVSGSGDVLIFKKVREVEPSPVSYTAFGPIPVDDPSNFDRPPPYSPINPIDGTTATGNFASPTGFVNHDAIFAPPQPLPEEEAPQPVAPEAAAPVEKVRREEDVFSGRSRWEDEPAPPPKEKKGKARKVVRRVFWVGVWVAACSYAVGVVAEFFRTGGSTGTLQGF
ncbi:MAG: hypothetical protein M1833_004067 [Piccolia ochrophora]|nr:MAG: hypothetical protein M1833_004067 [Piccolia ochrophora]